MGSSHLHFHSRPPPNPPLGSVAVHHLPVLHKFKTQQFCHLLPQHSHNNIAVGPSFSLYNKASWFSSLFFKLAAGCYNAHGVSVFDGSMPWSVVVKEGGWPLCVWEAPK